MRNYINKIIKKEKKVKKIETKFNVLKELTKNYSDIYKYYNFLTLKDYIGILETDDVNEIKKPIKLLNLYKIVNHVHEIEKKLWFLF